MRESQLTQEERQLLGKIRDHPKCSNYVKIGICRCLLDAHKGKLHPLNRIWALLQIAQSGVANA